MCGDELASRPAGPAKTGMTASDGTMSAASAAGQRSAKRTARWRGLHISFSLASNGRSGGLGAGEVEEGVNNWEGKPFLLSTSLKIA